MSFINWGSESPEQLKARREMEDQVMFEQMSYSAAVAAAAAAGSSKLKPSEFVGLVDWLAVAPAGASPNIDHDYEDFDNWETDDFTPLIGVKRLVIEADSASAHVHDNLAFDNLYIQLFNSETDSYVTVWSKRLLNPNYPGDGSDDFFMNGIDVTFPAIDSVTKIRLRSQQGSNQTYHEWGQDSTIFRFYK